MPVDIRTGGRATSILLACIVLGLVAGGVLADQPPRVAASQPDSGSTLVVDGDGSTDYRSIQAAVDAASTGDTVEVRPGTYAEQVVINDSIALVAPDGATLDGSSLPGEAWGLTINSGTLAEPVVDGLTITDFYVGIYAQGTAGSWTLRNVTIRNSVDDGVAAAGTAGRWSVRNTTVTGNDEGFDAENTTGAWSVVESTISDNDNDGFDVDGPRASGAWTVRDSTIQRNGDDGIDADAGTAEWTVADSTIANNRNGIQIVNASGDWTVRNSILRNNTAYGVYAVDGNGDWTIDDSHLRYNVITAVDAAGTGGAWTIRDTTVRDSQVAVYANATAGAWTITNASIRNTTIPEFDLAGEGTGVFAAQSTGDWAVHRTNFDGHPEHAINATGASTRGDATGNWWGGAGGPAADDCVGNVDCSDARPSPAAVPDPPTVAPEFDADAVADDGSEFGVVSMAIVGVLLAVVTVLALVAWRYT